MCLAPAASDFAATDPLRDPDGDHGDKDKEQRDHVDHRELIGALQLAKHPDWEGARAWSGGEEGDDHFVK